jgi:hypothetical protein
VCQQTNAVLDFVDANAKETPKPHGEVMYQSGGGLFGQLARAFIGKQLAEMDIWVVHFKEEWGAAEYGLAYYADDEWDARDQFVAEKGYGYDITKVYKSE